MVDFAFALDNRTFSDRCIQWFQRSVRPSPQPTNSLDDGDTKMRDVDDNNTNTNTTPSKTMVSNAATATSRSNDKPLLEMHVSSLLLAAHSAVWKTCFTCGMKESCETMVRVDVADQREADAHQAMVRFVYTQTIDKDAAVLDWLAWLAVADQYEMHGWTKAILQGVVWSHGKALVVLSNLSLSDSRLFATSLRTRAVQEVQHDRNPEHLHQWPGFVTWPLQAVQTLLSSDHLRVQSENTVLLAALTWIAAQPKGDAADPHRLLDAVRFRDVQKEYLTLTMLHYGGKDPVVCAYQGIADAQRAVMTTTKTAPDSKGDDVTRPPRPSGASLVAQPSATVEWSIPYVDWVKPGEHRHDGPPIIVAGYQWIPTIVIRPWGVHPHHTWHVLTPAMDYPFRVDTGTSLSVRTHTFHGWRDNVGFGYQTWDSTKPDPGEAETSFGIGDAYEQPVVVRIKLEVFGIRWKKA